MSVLIIFFVEYWNIGRKRGEITDDKSPGKF